jgi:hypothetical protein
MKRTVVLLQLLDLQFDQVVDRFDGNLVQDVNRKLLRLVRAESKPAQRELLLVVE